MFEKENPEFVQCPILNKRLYFMDCIMTSDAADGRYTGEPLAAEIEQNESWARICSECPYHGK